MRTLFIIDVVVTPHLEPSHEVASDELDAALFECLERSENGTHSPRNS